MDGHCCIACTSIPRSDTSHRTSASSLRTTTEEGENVQVKGKTHENHARSCISSQTSPKPLVQACEAPCCALQLACAPQPIRLRPSARPSVTRGGEENAKRLIETDGLAHGRLDVERLDVLPFFLRSETRKCVRMNERTMSGYPRRAL